MQPTELRAALEKLRSELAASERVDVESRELLGRIMGDINRLTDARPPVAPSPHPEGIADRLELAAVRFEADHPALAAATRRLVDLLGKAGL